MNKKDLQTLREAVINAPSNIALRLSLALKLFKINEFDESEKNYQQVLKMDSDNIKAKQGLIELYFAKGNYSTVIVIAEELGARNITSEKIMELQVKSLLKQNSLKEAQEIYNKILDRNPFYFDEELDSVLADDEEYKSDKAEKPSFGDEDFDGFSHMNELKIPDFINNPEIMYLPKEGNGFDDMIGQSYLKDVLNENYFVDELDEDIKQRYNLKNCSSMLLYGPPGCGKSFAVSCIPIEFEEDVLPFDWSRISDDSQSVRKDFILPFYFNMARMESPITLFLDRIEDIIGNNNPDSHLFQSQFSSEMDAAVRYNQDLFVIACSTAVWHLDPALLRSGRFDDCVFVAPPSDEDRKEYFVQYFKNLEIKVSKLDQLVDQTKTFSYSDIKSMCDKTVLRYVANKIKNTNEAAIKVDHFIKTLPLMKSTCSYWFEQMQLESSATFKSTQIFNTINDYIIQNKS
jgi:transitional endoplasmic reticulum ATPase